MKTPLGRIRGAGITALGWAAAWAPLGVLLGLALDPSGSMDEPWIAVGAYPGFLSALLFSAGLAVTDRRRGLADMPLSRAVVIGAASGLLVILLPTVLLGTPNTEHALYQLRYYIIGAVTLLGAWSAVASVWVARALKQRGLRNERARPI